MTKPKMRASNAQFQGLWEAIHATRDKSETVKVNKAAISAVLIDHSLLLDTFRNQIEQEDF